MGAAGEPVRSAVSGEVRNRVFEQPLRRTGSSQGGDQDNSRQKSIERSVAWHQHGLVFHNQPCWPSRWGGRIVASRIRGFEVEKLWLWMETTASEEAKTAFALSQTISCNSN
jgi:hypothetical protein